MIRQAIVAILCLCIVGCASKTVPARLYDLSSAEVIEARFQFSGTTHGMIAFTLDTGETFRGEYQTVKGGSHGWGNVYGTVWGPSGSVRGSASSYVTVMPTEYTGSAVMRSDRGRLITCEYISNTSRWNPHGQGACQDNTGKIYKLMY